MPSRRKSTGGSHRAAKRRRASTAMAYRAPFQASPYAWGPKRQVWPKKVAVVAYGRNANYSGGMWLKDLQSEWHTVDSPVDLLKWASGMQVGMTT